MIVEAIDKVADVSRDYLVAPTATTAAPAVDILPKPWPEFIMAVLFIVVTLAIKSFHKHHKLHKAAQQQHKQPGGGMYAGDLRRGDVFIECSAEEWAAMSPRDQKKAKRVRVVAIGPACRDKTRVHLSTDVGNWCILHVAPVMYAPAVKPKSRAA